VSRAQSGLLAALCVSSDALFGFICVAYPALALEWLYPERSGLSPLIWIEQGGWLLLARAAWVFKARATRARWLALWWVAAPLHIWSLSALSHLGRGGALWHAVELLLTALLALSQGHEEIKEDSRG